VPLLHHDRVGQGPLCHAAIEKDWQTPAGIALVVKWARLTGFLGQISARV